VFAFSSLWFAHFCMDALDRLRKEEMPAQKDNLKLKADVSGIESAQSATDLIVDVMPKSLGTDGTHKP
jgi:hypothetical protein